MTRLQCVRSLLRSDTHKMNWRHYPSKPIWEYPAAILWHSRVFHSARSSLIWAVHAIKRSDKFESHPILKEKIMKNVQIYDKPMCCSTGVCGPQVDPILPRFAADLDWLKSQGNQVERFNLAQQPMAFIENKEVHQLLGSEGTDCLPLILVNGKIISRKEYPTREVMASWVDTTAPKQLLPFAKSGGCCGSTGSC